ncbi:hypothetical protein [Rhizomonospora bruguierae]|uniref:hypothetical protein n=1 Tax=Rhizomonospora bruguierae TaxID=1581705 RepID=UPI001BCC5F03|nr:hypothetical protein [Micromonospora sp. NBRC 107566]
MIFDGGGPGVSNLSGITAGFEEVAKDAQTRGYNVLVIDEPWVVAPYESRCRSAMASFYRESIQRYPHLASARTVAATRQNCLVENDSAVLTAEDYRAAVDKIEHAEKVSVARLEGYSFASVRAAYLGSVRPHMVVAVSSPFPVGASAADFYSTVGANGSVPDITASGGLTADSAVAYYLSTGTPPGGMDAVTAARALWQVNSEGDMSLSRVGYYSEICSVFTRWPNLLGAVRKAGSAVAALAALHAPCAGEQPTILKLPRKICFAVLQHDPNSPWVPSPVTRRAHINIVANGQHGKVAIPACP